MDVQGRSAQPARPSSARPRQRGDAHAERSHSNSRTFPRAVPGGRPRSDAAARTRSRRHSPRCRDCRGTRACLLLAVKVACPTGSKDKLSRFHPGPGKHTRSKFRQVQGRRHFSHLAPHPTAWTNQRQSSMLFHAVVDASAIYLHLRFLQHPNNRISRTVT